ncbi:MAG TPA: TolC family outer membrane protein [Aquella sp.]|nr:TolC family outer membrane protein [Aquella sp.]
MSTSYTNALSYNADYLGQIAKNLAGQESVALARSQLLPQISATGGYSENYLGAPGSSVYYHQPTINGQLSQVIFDWSKYSQYTKGKYGTQVADLQLANAKQKLIVDVASSYFDVLYAIDVLNSIKITKSALEKQLNQAKKSFSAGTVTIADVNDAQAGFDSASAQQIQAENDLINKKNIFRNLVGLNPELIQPLIDNLKLVTPMPVTAQSWSDKAQTGNVNIKIAMKQVEMAKQDVRIAIAGHLPSLNVAGSYLYQGSGGIDGQNSTVAQSESVPGTPLSSYTTGSLGLQVNIPIYSGGAINSQVRSADANYVQSQQQLISLQRQTDQNIKNAFWQVQNGVSIVKAQTQALKSAKLKLDSDRLGYQVGVRNSIDLVNSEKNYATAIQNYNQARYQYLNYRLQLYYLAGNIDKNYLAEINTNVKSIN